MADNRPFGSRTFWIGALCGAAAAYFADRLRQRSRGSKGRLSLIRGGAAVVRIPLKRDDATGDPAALAPDRGTARPGFERRGGAPGGVTAAEMQETPGHPGQRLDHSDPAHPVRSASRTQLHPPSA